MSNTLQIQENPDVAFFGRINASISHEIKNILAIISETSGLLNDLSELAQKGQSIDTNMIKTCSQDIEEEIQRGFATIKEMNRFSHSVDQTIAKIDPVDLVTRMVNIASYLSYASKIKVTAPDDADFKISTCPFRLQQLIYRTLVFLFHIEGPEGEIEVSVQPESQGQVKISFTSAGERDVSKFPKTEMDALAESINAQITASDDFQSFDIIVS